MSNEVSWKLLATIQKHEHEKTEENECDEKDMKNYILNQLSKLISDDNFVPKYSIKNGITQLDDYRLSNLLKKIVDCNLHYDYEFRKNLLIEYGLVLDSEHFYLLQYKKPKIESIIISKNNSIFGLKILTAVPSKHSPSNLTGIVLGETNNDLSGCAVILMIKNMENGNVLHLTDLEKMSRNGFVDFFKTSNLIKIEAMYDGSLYEQSFEQLIDKMRKERKVNVEQEPPPYFEVTKID